MTTLYWADPDDDTHATIGLNLAVGPGATGFQFIRLHWGDIDPEIDWQSEGEVPGAEQVRRHPGPVQAELTLFADFSAADFQSKLEAYQLLGQFLEGHGVLVWQPDGADEPRFFDTYPSPVPALFRGTPRQGVQVLEQLIDEGYTFRIWHHPYPRRAAVTLLDGVAVTNLVGDNVLQYTNPGSALSEARLEIEVPGTEDVVQARAGFRSGDSSEFAASLSGYAITSPTIVRDYWRQVDRKVLTPVDPAAFAGVYRVVATARLAADIFHIELHHGSSRDNNEPLSQRNEEVMLDAEDLSNFDPFVEIDLGLVKYDATSPSLVLEIHAWSEGDTDMTAWGDVRLIPADRGAFVYSSPGYRGGAFGLRVFKGSMFNLFSGATLEGDEDDVVSLGGPDERCEVRPVAGQTLPLGMHVLAFRGTVVNRNRERAKIGEMRVLEDDVVIRTIGLHSRRRRVQTYYGSEFIRQAHWKVNDDTKLYRFEVERTTLDDFPVIRVAALRHHYIPSITEGRRAVVDSGTRETRLEDADGARIAALRATGLPWLDPGPGAVAFTLGEQASHGYAHVDERMILPKITDATQAAVTLTVTPRDLQA